MTDSNGAGGHPTRRPLARTVELGGRTVTIEPVSGRKASRAFAILRAVGERIPELVKEYGAWVSDYEATNVVELDRAQAAFRYPPRPIIGDDGEPVRDADGNIAVAPGPLASMTDEAWEAAGQKLRLPRSPSNAEALVAMFPRALDAAEENVYRLLALFTMPNGDVKAYRRDGSLPDRLQDLADELLDDAGADELLELAVVCGEVIEEQLTRKTRELGDRLGNALRLLGMNPPTGTGPTTGEPQTGAQAPTAPSTPEPSTSRPTSPTDSAADTDGTPTPLSTSHSSSSPLSPIGSTANGS